MSFIDNFDATVTSAVTSMNSHYDRSTPARHPTVSPAVHKPLNKLEIGENNDARMDCSLRPLAGAPWRPEKTLNPLLAQEWRAMIEST